MRIGKWLGILIAGAAIAAAGGGAGWYYWPELRELALRVTCHETREGRHQHEEHEDEEAAHAKQADAKKADPGPEHGEHADHGEHDDEHEAADHDHDNEHRDQRKAGKADHASDHKHEEASTVRLSANAQANVGLRLAKVELKAFERTITVPGMVIERPGRSELQVAAPLTGVVTRIWALQGEAVCPGQPLFDLRLTHEEVVEAQAEFLRTAEELDVLRREIQRLSKVAAEGAIPGKTLLERTYEQQKLEGVFRAQRQRLLLHSLSEAQVDQIAAKRELLSVFTVSAPSQCEDAPSHSGPCQLQVEELKVTQGQHVKAGDSLCVLADHCRLYIQGMAFEQDIPTLQKNATSGGRVTAVLEANGAERPQVPGLQIVYLASKVQPDTRAFLFYVDLPNQILPPREGPDRRRFSGWRFKPGQRVDLLVPIERWPERIVLPVAAVVQDGPEAYVFEVNDGHFDRRAVRVEYRDQYSAVIANDGTLGPGKMVVVAGAYQVHLALKNKSGGGPDPHAGHNH
jgi:multidrug efflux pump subunit AcrA (membrane-fusion protein)